MLPPRSKIPGSYRARPRPKVQPGSDCLFVGGSRDLVRKLGTEIRLVHLLRDEPTKPTAQSLFRQTSTTVPTSFRGLEPGTPVKKKNCVKLKLVVGVRYFMSLFILWRSWWRENRRNDDDDQKLNKLKTAAVAVASWLSWLDFFWFDSFLNSV